MFGLEVKNIYKCLTYSRSNMKRPLAPDDIRNSSPHHEGKQVTLNQRGTVNRTVPVGDAFYR